MPVASWSDSQVLTQLDSGLKWANLTITYSFPTFPSGMHGSDEQVGFMPLDSGTQAMIRLALQTWDDLIPNSFQQVASSSNIEVGFSATEGGFAHAYFPSVGSVWFNSAYTYGVNNLVNAQPGEYGFLTYIHELGHALGLHHMGDYDGEGTWTPSSYQDSTVYSVMSYFGPTGPYRSTYNAQADWTNAQGVEVSPQTPMLNDAMAIQSMYGTSTTTRTDNTTYGFNCTVGGTVRAIYDFTLNASPVLTLFDSAGTDTLDLSGWGTASIVNLAPGSFSSANSMTNNIAIAYTCTIENAAGGSGSDAITGNSVANQLAGNAGNDTLAGGAGDDTLVGGSGNDSLDGGTGNDTAVFGGSYADYDISFNAVTGVYTLTGGSTGTDLVTGMEFFQFGDQLRPVAQLLSSDNGAPTLASTSPADNASGASLSSNIVLTFSEAVQAGSGSITIYNANNTVFASIPVTDASQVSVSGSTVTINPTANFVAGASYYVLVASGALKDLAGNAFAGIASASALNFSVAAGSDTLAPTLVSTTPADNAGGVAIGANLTFTFSEAVHAGSGSITIYNASNQAVRTISASDGSQVSFSGSTMTVNPSSDFSYATGYYVKIAAGAVVDAAGNAYAGISTSTAFNFTTAASSLVDDYPMSFDTTGVVLTNGVVTTGVVNTSGDYDLFRVALVAGTTYVFDLRATGLLDPYLQLYDPAGNYLTYDDDGGPVGVDSQLVFTAGSTGTYFLAVSDAYDTGTGSYALTAMSNADDYPWSTDTSGVVAVNGSASNGTISYADDLDLFRVTLTAGQSYIFELTSTGLDDPYLMLFSPALDVLEEDDDGDGSLNSRIEFTATVSGTYYLGAMDYGSGTGTYTLRASQNTDDYPWSTATTGIVTVNGAAVAGAIDYAGDADLLKVTLSAGVTYSFEVDRTSGGLDDPYLRLYDAGVHLLAYDDDSAGSFNSRITYTPSQSGTFYLGVSDYSSGTGGYTVHAHALDVTAPTLQATSPSDNATNVAVGSNFTLTFSEAVHAGSGSIVIYNANGTVARTIAVSDTSQVTFSGSTMTVNPAGDLAYGNGYYVNVSPGAVLDASGNAYGGLSNATSFSFTTVAPAGDDYPLSTSTNGAVSVGGAAVHGTINYADDGDLFKVNLVAGQAYEFDLVRSASNGLDDPYLQLYNPSLTLVGIDDDSGGSLNSRLFYTAPVTGTYYLAAWDYSTATGAYTLQAIAAGSTIEGTPAGDSLAGSDGVDVMHGLAGADILRGRGGNDQIDGGDGIDTAVFSGNRASYTVTTGLASSTISGPDGSDSLVSIERLQFDDARVAIDLSGHAGDVAKALGAVFGADAVANELYVGIGLALLDAGTSYESLMQLALDARLGAGASHAEVVQLLYTNVVGAAPDAFTLSGFVALLDGGTYTPGSLAVMAAGTSINLAHIGFADLSLTGLDYV